MTHRSTQGNEATPSDASEPVQFDDVIKYHKPAGPQSRRVKNLKRKRNRDAADAIECQRDETLAKLVETCLEVLGEASRDDSIQQCGAAPLQIVDSRPEEVLALAEKKLNTWPYAEVPDCWRRLYEEASVWMVVHRLRSRALNASTTSDLQHVPRADDDHSQDWIAETVHLVDKAIVVSGAPHRRRLFDEILASLDPYAQEVCCGSLRYWNIAHPQPLDTAYPVSRADKELTMDEFQANLEDESIGPVPIIVPGVIHDWPAKERWQDLDYLLGATHGGRRLVPVEIGQSYTDDSWSQKMMTVAEFVEKFLIPEQPHEVGYIAQHDLLAQVPQLRADIMTPDYCWTQPPAPSGAALSTAGLSKTTQLDAPTVLAWLGPKGTKSPLHTDPYHNILCQVVGHKYVRLYAPEETANVYPQGHNESGIDLANTSAIHVEHFRPDAIRKSLNPEMAASLHDEYPDFKDAKYVEGILAPGECLYIPLGYWHYVESLTASISVSFWWN